MRSSSYLAMLCLIPANQNLRKYAWNVRGSILNNAFNAVFYVSEMCSQSNITLFMDTVNEAKKGH